MFSFYLPDGAAPAAHRDEVLRRMAVLIEMADQYGKVLWHENERGNYGEAPAECHDLHTTFDVPAFRALWDPGNFAVSGYRPFEDSWHLLAPYIANVHGKDYSAATGKIVVAGAGDAQWPQCIAALRQSGYDGILAMEPHLQSGGRSGGFTGPELFAEAVAALHALLTLEV